MESWRKVWREGAAPLISDQGLEALRVALEKDDPRLIQGATTIPPPLLCVQDWPVEAACLLGYCGWIGENLTTVGKVEEYFANLCHEIDQKLGGPGYHHLLVWFDEQSRDSMRKELLGEVLREFANRGVLIGEIH